MAILANLPIFQKFTIADSGKIVYIRDVEQTKDFYISFIHSVNKTPVYEFYRVEDGSLMLYKTVFYSYGAGMPEANVTFVDDTVVIDGLDTELPEFSVFVGTVAKHEITFSDVSFPLTNLAPPQSLLNFKIKRLSFIKIITAVMTMPTLI